MDIEKTEAWQAADWRYTAMLAQDMMPVLGTTLTEQERIDLLKEILTDCPEYYPALFESGFRSLKEGKDEEARDFIDKGLQSLKTHFPREDLLDAYYQVCEVLEKHLRFEKTGGQSLFLDPSLTPQPLFSPVDTPKLALGSHPSTAPEGIIVPMK